MTRSSFRAARAQDCGACPPPAGRAQAIAKPDTKKGELKYLLPQILPGGQTVLFTVTHTPLPTWDDTEIVAQSLATGKRTVLIHGGADGRYLRSGHLLYLRRGTLMAVPFDLERLEVTGGAVALIADVMQAANTPSESSDSGAGQFSVSESGSLLYLPGGIFPDPERSLVWVDRTGDGAAAAAARARVSLAAPLARRPSRRPLDARRPERLGARPCARHADPPDVRGEERARHLDAGRHTRDIRIGHRRQ